MISIFLAKFFSIYLIIVCSLMLLNKSVFTDALKEISKSPALMLLVGVMTLITGILLVLLHNIWYVGWALVITILAWFSLISGIIRTGFPHVAVKMMSNAADNNKVYYTTTGILLLLGIYLGYFGFM